MNNQVGQNENFSILDENRLTFFFFNKYSRNCQGCFIFLEETALADSSSLEISAKLTR